MADLDLIRRVTEQQDIKETQKDKSNTRTKLAALAMGAIISGTQVQANDLLAQCDYNNNGIIDGRTYLKGLKKDLKADGNYSEEDKNIYKIALKNAKKERACKTKIIEQETAQMKQETAQMKVYLAQLDMSVDNLKKELKKVEAEIDQLTKKSDQLTKKSDQLTKKSDQLTKKDKILKKELERKKRWLLEQIKKAQQSFT